MKDTNRLRSWSRSGRLLASGSDDTHLNIYSYQPDSSTAPFALNTTILTGHRNNIFSVKFMPYSNDRTLVTAAMDGQVRIFDIDYASSAPNNIESSSAFSARSRRSGNFFSGVPYLSEHNTNGRCYRSHTDAVKRIVTESSPYLFLTCSEDGDVRQWDLRQPSSAYPSHRSNVPAPLISYRRYGIDLNAISCSPSQPHYIALGGGHPHCFLHDRRMLGRDCSMERGTPSGSPRSSRNRDAEFGAATRCVRRFAPEGRSRMGIEEQESFITCCKISDYNPDEMIVSWSGDHIYSFDLLRSADALDNEARESGAANNKSRKRKTSKSRKRKRQLGTSTSSGGSSNRHQSRQRSTGLGDANTSNLPDPISGAREEAIDTARYSVTSDTQSLSLRIASSLVNIRKALFSLEASVREATTSLSDTGPTPVTESFSLALGEASTCLYQMDNVMKSWAYPINPTEETVAVQHSLRRDRGLAWMFVQAAGVLAQNLGASISVVPGERRFEMGQFENILPPPAHNVDVDPVVRFCYSFLKAIILWLNGGRPTLLAGFKNYGSRRWNANYATQPEIPETADDNAIDDILIPHLLALASNSPVVNVDASRFEHDASRILFQTQESAVMAFKNATRARLVDFQDTGTDADGRPVMNRAEAKNFWALKVGRGVLMEGSSDVNFLFTRQAFGGVRIPAAYNSDSEGDSDSDLERSQDDIEPDEPPFNLEGLSPLVGLPSGVVGLPPGLVSESDFHDSNESSSEGGDDEGEDESEDDDDDDDDDGDTVAGDVPSDDDYSDIDTYISRRGLRSRKGEAESDVPCSSHKRVYRGHCNISTVKDVNFFGLNDEYVVSGSDSGHLFIWDRESSNLVNILRADGSTVNVMEGML